MDLLGVNLRKGMKATIKLIQEVMELYMAVYRTLGQAITGDPYTSGYA